MSARTCAKGHLIDGTNAITRGDSTSTRCRTCTRERQNTYRAIHGRKHYPKPKKSGPRKARHYISADERAQRQIQVGLLYQQGIPVDDIAAQLNTTRSTVRRDLDDMGFDIGPLHPGQNAAAQRRADLAQRHHQFPTQQAAATHYGVSTAAIADDCRALGIRIDGRGGNQRRTA